MRQAIMGQQLGKAIAEVFGIDLKRAPVLDAEISAKPDELACVTVRIALQPGQLAQIEAVLERLQGQSGTKIG